MWQTWTLAPPAQAAEAVIKKIAPKMAKPWNLRFMSLYFLFIDYFQRVADRNALCIISRVGVGILSRDDADCVNLW
jgi:hypothetical protein